MCLRCGSIELESWRVRAEGRVICKCDGMKYRRWERDGKRSERFETLCNFTIQPKRIIFS